MKYQVAIALFIFLGFAGIGYGADAPPIGSLDDNPYVQLYRLRVTQAELNQSRQQALHDLATARLGRGKKLLPSMAISAEEYDVMVSEYNVTQADLRLSAKKIEEAKNFLKIVEALVKRGVAIPLCMSDME